MKIHSNFSTDDPSAANSKWNQLCGHCNRPHKDHISMDMLADAKLKTVVSWDRYIHRMPCAAERKFMIGAQQKTVRDVIGVLVVWEILKYLWEKLFEIPILAMKVWSLIKSIGTMIKIQYQLCKNK